MKHMVRSYEIRPERHPTPVTLHVPKGARVLGVGVERSLPAVWMLVDPLETEMVKQRWLAIPSNCRFDAGIVDYAGSFEVYGYQTVHVFRVDGGATP